MLWRRTLLVLLGGVLASGLCAAEETLRLSTNGRDEVKCVLVNGGAQTEQYQLPAGSVCTTAGGERVVTLQALEMKAAPHNEVTGTAPAAALARGNHLLADQPAQLRPQPEPALMPLLRYLSTQRDIPRPTSQCAVLALEEDLTFAQWLEFRTGIAQADEPLVEAVDALGLLRVLVPGRSFALAQDPALKMRALHTAVTRTKAAQIFGLKLPGDGLPGQVPPDLSQLLHTKPGDNCPICRMRAQMQAPQNDL